MPVYLRPPPPCCWPRPYRRPRWPLIRPPDRRSLDCPLPLLPPPTQSRRHGHWATRVVELMCRLSAPADRYVRFYVFSTRTLVFIGWMYDGSRCSPRKAWPGGREQGVGGLEGVVGEVVDKAVEARPALIAMRGVVPCPAPLSVTATASRGRDGATASRVPASANLRCGFND